MVTLVTLRDPTRPDEWELPDWDSTHHEGDDFIPLLLCNIPHEHKQPSIYRRKHIFYRPKNVDEFERLMLTKMNYNQERWETLAYLLRSDEKLWLYFTFSEGNKA